MIAFLLLAYLSTAHEIVLVLPQNMPVRRDAIAAEVIDFLGPDDRLAVVDQELRLRAAFTKDREAIRRAIRSDEAGTDPFDIAGKRLVVVTWGVGEPRVLPLQLEPGTLVLNTSRGGEISAGLVDEHGAVKLHRRTSLRKVAELVPTPPDALAAPNAQVAPEPPKESPSELAMKLFVDAMRRLHDDDDEGVEAILDEVIATDPQLADAWYERGMLAAAREDHEAAARDLRKYLALAPQGKHAADAREFLDALKPKP